MQEQAELVGPEAMATEPVGKAAVFQIVNPLLGRAALHVPIVERQRSIRAGGDHEAGVGALGQGFGFVDHPALVRPGGGGIGGLAGQAHLLAGVLVLPLGFRQQRRGHGLQTGVRGQADRVGDAFRFAPGGESGHGKAAVGAQLDGDPRRAGPQGTHHPLEDGDHPPAGVHGAGPQDGGDELVGLAVEDEQRMIHVLAVVAVVGAAFLLAVRRVVGAIQIEQDVGGRTGQSGAD